MTLNSSSVAPSPASSTSSPTASVGGSAVVNASRLRENQRRSRARKKEYLLSLEARFQACQRTGIEANIDIQIAAKKVVRENLILRGMLKVRGVTDGELDKTLRDGGEGCANGETAVQGVLKVLGKRPCSGGPTVGGTGMQCKPTGAPPPPPPPPRATATATATERRNSTGMVAARDTDRGGGTGLVAVSTSKQLSLSISPQQRHTLSNYPTPTPTPTAAPASNYAPASSSAHMNSFYSYDEMSPSPTYASPIANSPPRYSSPTVSNSPLAYASPKISHSPPTYTSYQMTPSVSNSCSYYPPTQQQCAPSLVAVSSPCCQRSMYSTTMSSSSPECSYQTRPISSTTACHLAQSYINQLHPGLPDEDTSHLVNSICPPDMMQEGQCQVDNAVLFAVLDRI